MFVSIISCEEINTFISNHPGIYGYLPINKYSLSHQSPKLATTSVQLVEYTVAPHQSIDEKSKASQKNPHKISHSLRLYSHRDAHTCEIIVDDSTPESNISSIQEAISKKCSSHSICHIETNLSTNNQFHFVIPELVLISQE
jgi:hypothetical protein